MKSSDNMDIMNKSLKLHEELKGKIEIKSKAQVKNKDDLSLVYTPGVAASCLAISKDVKRVYQLTSKGNTVAVISDGTAVLGLGNIGPEAAIPVLEGKCVLFKEFAGIDAIPIVLNTTDPEELIKTIAYLAPSYGGINLEDISAPRCFEVERRLKELLDIPVFHDDQHGTAIACGAALLNALKIVHKDLSNIQIVVNGAGSAGIAITNFLTQLGARNIVVCDIAGVLDPDDEGLNDYQKVLAKRTNPNSIRGSLEKALEQSDVFIGVSVGNIVNQNMVRKMNQDPIIFAMANPTPEISREEALLAGARIYGAGVSNVPNQINNALVFPGIFKGALKARVKNITVDMEVAAAKAISGLIQEDELNEEYIIPDVFDKRVSEAISNEIVKRFKNI